MVAGGGRNGIMNALALASALFAIILIGTLFFANIAENGEGSPRNCLERCPDCNIILVVFDVFSATHTGFSGNTRNATPNLDILAGESVVFTRAVSQSPYTVPSEISLISGKFPSRMRAFTIPGYESDVSFNVGEMLPKALEAYGGYKTVAINYPATMSGLVTDGNRRADFIESVPVPYRPGAQGRMNLTDVFSELSKKTAEMANSGEKTFIYFQTGFLHSPYDSPDIERVFYKNYTGIFENLSAPGIWPVRDGRTVNRSGGEQHELGEDDFEFISARYDDKLLVLDREFGRFLRAANDSGALDNTILIVTGYHGEGLGENGNFDHWLSVEGVHVPLVIRIPGNSPGKAEKVVELVDIYPTLLDAVGVGAPKGLALDGKSLVCGSSFDKKVAISESEFWEFPEEPEEGAVGLSGEVCYEAFATDGKTASTFSYDPATGNYARFWESILLERTLVLDRGAGKSPEFLERSAEERLGRSLEGKCEKVPVKMIPRAIKGELFGALEPENSS